MSYYWPEQSSSQVAGKWLTQAGGIEDASIRPFNEPRQLTTPLGSGEVKTPDLLESFLGQAAGILMDSMELPDLNLPGIDFPILGPSDPAVYPTITYPDTPYPDVGDYPDLNYYSNSVGDTYYTSPAGEVVNYYTSLYNTNNWNSSVRGHKIVAPRIHTDVNDDMPETIAEKDILYYSSDLEWLNLALTDQGTSVSKLEYTWAVDESLGTLKIDVPKTAVTVVTDVQVTGTTLQMKTRVFYVPTAGLTAETAWVTWHTGTICTTPA